MEKKIIVAVLIIGVIIYFYSTSKKGNVCDKLNDNDPITEECFLYIGKTLIKELQEKFNTYYSTDCPAIGKDRLKELLDSMKQSTILANDTIEQQLKFAFENELKPKAITFKEVKEQIADERNTIDIEMGKAINSICTQGLFAS